MLLRRPLDVVLDRLDLVLLVLGRVILVVDVAPGGSDVLGRVNGVFLVDGVGEFDVAVFVLASFGFDVFALVDLLGHGSMASKVA
jgi:hypothetical protein